MQADFLKDINDVYNNIKGDYFTLGVGMLDGESVEGAQINIPLKTLNRHGLIAGATGTGKTKTLQILAENLSAKGVPVMLMDVKGDLSGIAAAGNNHPKIDERHAKIGIPFTPKPSPSELVSISDEPGAKMRATVSEFGPVLFSKMLDLNDTQTGVVSVIFKYCDDEKMPLLDIKDFRKLLQFATDEGKEIFKERYGNIATSSAGAILRKLVELEQQGADKFFGEPSFDIEDLMRINENGAGIVSILRLTDIQSKPKMFSTFMLCLLAEIYARLPEAGDSDAPKLVLFIDEAHLIFKNASKALLEQIESIVKLIRSKGVGLFFVTQNPTDVPDAVLSQLGLKIQHALRAFTAKDRKMIKVTAENYPISTYYKTDQVLTSLGIGEALVTALNEKGIPTPLAATLLRAPMSRMDVLEQKEIDDLVKKSSLIKKYEEDVDRESAYEMLQAKLEDAEQDKEEDEKVKAAPKKRGRPKEEKGMLRQMAESSTGKMILKEVTRGLLGVLGLKPTRRRSKKKTSSWF